MQVHLIQSLWAPWHLLRRFSKLGESLYLVTQDFYEIITISKSISNKARQSL